MSGSEISWLVGLPIVYFALGMLNMKGYFMLVPEHWNWTRNRGSYYSPRYYTGLNWPMVIALLFFWPVSFLCTAVAGAVKFGKPNELEG